MERLGYYAKCEATGNLHIFTWSHDNNFMIKTKSEGWVKRDVINYEILEIGFFTANN